MEIHEIKNKDTWEKFVLSSENKTFLHSWNWGEFNQAMGEKIWRLGIYGNFFSNEKPAIDADYSGTTYSTVVRTYHPAFIIAGQDTMSSADKIKAVEGTGFAPVDSWMVSPNRHYTPPTAELVYQNSKQDTIEQNDSLLAVALIIKVKAKRGSFLFCPQGPVINLKCKMKNEKSQCKIKNEQILKTLVCYLKNLAAEEKVSFIRISPILLARRSLGEGGEDMEKNRDIFRKLGFRPAPIHMHAETTWTLDVTPPEEEILANMRKTTRHCIKKAQKDGVEILTGNKLEDLEKFSELYQKTAKRQGFVPFSFEYLKDQLEAFVSDNQIQVFLARYNDKIISGAVIVYYGDSGYYHHGASSQEYPKIPASYLLQWEAIKEAKKRGCRFYNFWGITKQTTNNKQQTTVTSNHPWAGLTLFKTGFGGFQTNYLHAQDLPLKKSYWITYLIEVIRRLRRHL